MAQKSTTYTQSFSVFCKYIYAGKKKSDCAVFFLISIVLIMYDVVLLVSNNENDMLLMCL